jgi:hypothetical protein
MNAVSYWEMSVCCITRNTVIYCAGRCRFFGVKLSIGLLTTSFEGFKDEKLVKGYRKDKN